MSQHKQRGAVSLFIVIFAALLIITIVTAFVRIMLQDQQQATASDLSKSAMDSAQAGVEDTKRALVEYYKKDCSQVTTDRCAELRDALLNNIDTQTGWSINCDTTRRAGVAVMNDDEVKVETNASDATLNQAYTCVKVQMQPESYVGNSTSQLIRLKSKDNAAFDKIKIQWYEQQAQGDELNLDDSAPQNYELLDSWPAKRPQILRLQLLQYGTDFALNEFDGNYQNNSSLFLLPTDGGATTTTFAVDLRKSNGSGAANRASCEKQPDKGEYACTMTIDLPQIGDPAATSPRNAYLKVDQLYATGNTKFSVTMLNASDPNPVRFSDVQVVVDSTGRANDLFRRIQSRVDVGGSIPTPDAAVDVTRSLCKEFLVTNTDVYPGTYGDKCPLP